MSDMLIQCAACRDRSQVCGIGQRRHLVTKVGTCDAGACSSRKGYAKGACDSHQGNTHGCNGTLDIIGRRHTVEQTKNAFHLARESGFDNINMDLIVGLPGEDITKVQHTLDEVKALGPDSLTVHSLAVKRAARLNIFRDQYQEMTFENNQEIMNLTMKTAYEMGMGPYYLYRQKNMKGNFENVGYSEVDKAGIYNILIMEEKQPIIALGAGGSSKLVFEHGQRIERVENVKDVVNYITRIDEMIERKREGIAKWL